MPLHNRVTPWGELTSAKAGCGFIDNRCWPMHTDARTLTTRRWASRQWICCVLDFRDRQRDVWGRFYTELFFLDEVTALAAGHRPCFECRRRDAELFAKAFAPRGRRMRAPEMDVILHRERLDGREKRLHPCAIDGLPDGAMIARDGQAFALHGKRLLQWTPSGYRAAGLRPRNRKVDVLTPPSILRTLANGYLPGWHPSAR